MILHIVWRTEEHSKRKPQMIVAQAVWQYGEWICYRKPGNPKITHYIPGSAVWEITVEEQPGDPDPMGSRPGPT